MFDDIINHYEFKQKWHCYWNMINFQFSKIIYYNNNTKCRLIFSGSVIYLIIIIIITKKTKKKQSKLKNIIINKFLSLSK